METKPEYETKALVPYQSLTPGTWGMILKVAETVHKGRLFKTANPEQAAAIMLKGHELGLPLMASFEFIDSFLGQTSLKPQGVLALLHGSPLCAKIKIEDQVDDQGNPWACKVTMERSNGFSHTITFTMDDARRAGVVKAESGWEHWPANMLRWRATGFCADVVFPDIGGGMKRTDELANVDQEGNMIDATPSNDVWSTVDPDPEPEPITVTMAYLLKTWGPLQVMKTTQELFEKENPTIPNEDQLEAVAAELERTKTPKMYEAF